MFTCTTCAAAGQGLGLEKNRTIREASDDRQGRGGLDMTGVVIVTGASRGIGAATAQRAAKAGHAVIVNYHAHGEEAEAVATNIMAEGGRAEPVRADMASASDIVAMFAAADRMGP